MCNQNYWQMGSLANKDFSLSTETMVWDLVWERGQGGEASISMVAQPRGEALEGNYGGLGCEALKGRWLQGNWDLGGLQQHTVLLHHALHFHSTFHCTVEVSRPPPSLHWHWPRCQGCLMSGQICECEVREHGTPSSPEMTRTVTKFAFTSVLRTVSSWQMPKYEEMHFWSLSPGIRVAFYQYQTW